MNTLNQIHYVVEIITDTSLTIPEIGLDNGVFRIASDGYNPVAVSATYEDNIPVQGTYYTEILHKDGISTSNQSVDIIVGGDYAFLSSLNVKLINTSDFVVKMLKTSDLYIIGCPMYMYVAIDDVLYTRWSGVVGGYNFDDETFTLEGKDSHNTDNDTVTNYVFGSTFIKIDSTETAGEPILTNVPIAFSDVRNDSLFNNSYQPTVHYPRYRITRDNYASQSYRFYNGFSHFAAYNITHNNNTLYDFYLNTDTTQIQTEMFAKFGDQDKLFKINSLNRNQIYSTDEYSYWRNRITVDQYPDEILDYTQYYGMQPYVLNYAQDPYSITVKDETAKFNKDGKSKMTVDIYDNTFKVNSISGTDWITDESGRFVTIDTDGKPIFVNGYFDSYGNINISNTTSQYLKPATVSMKVSVDKNIKGQLEDGSLKNIQSLPWTEVNLDNRFDISGTYTDSGYNYLHMYKVDFNIDNTECLPAILLSNMVSATMGWTDRANFSLSHYIHASDSPLYFGTLATSAQTSAYDISPTVIYSSSITTDEHLLNNIIFPQYEINIYKLYKTQDFGEVAEWLSSFTVINGTIVEDKYLTSAWDTTKSYGDGAFDKSFIYPQEIGIAPLPSTNVIPESITNKNNDKIIGGAIQASWYSPYASISYPDGLVDIVEATADGFETSAGFKSSTLKPTAPYMITIEPSTPSNAGAQDRLTFTKYGFKFDNGTSATESNSYTKIKDHKFSVGVNSIGSVQTTELTSITDLAFATTTSATETLPKLLGDLAKTTVTSLPNREHWYVGGQVVDQTNTFNLVTDICQQSFIVGYTARDGSVKFQEMFNFDDPIYNGDNNIIRDSIQNYSLSPIDKTYNEFTVKFQKVLDNFKLTLGVYNVDSDIFPDQWETYGTTVTGVSGGAIEFWRDGAGCTIRCVFTDKRPSVGDLVKFTDSNGKYLYGYVDHIGTVGTNPATWVDIIPTDTDIAVPPPLYSSTIAPTDLYWGTNLEWQSYVTGVNSYMDAKDIWTRARKSYLLNKRIRTAPTARTNLEFAIEPDYYTDPSFLYADTDGYAYEYFNMLIDWTSRQKLQLKYKLPLTSETVKYELMQPVQFYDSLIIPAGQVGRGWITGLQLDTKKALLNVTLTFEPDFVAPPSVIDFCVDIIETGYNSIDIVEEGDNTIDIEEGICGR